MHSFKVSRSADEIEALDGGRVAVRSGRAHRYNVGDSVKIVSSDGCTFIGTVYDTEPHFGLVHVELD